MKKQLFLLLALCCSAFVTVQAQDVFEIYCGESITLQPDGGVLGTNASWKWYSNSCGGSFLYAGTSYTVSPKTSTTYYVRAEGSCGTTTCRSVVVSIKPPSLTISRSAIQATEGYVMTFTATGYPTGGTLVWGNATSIGSNAATATMKQTAATNTINGVDYYTAFATYTIAAGNECKSSGSNNTAYSATCPYTGSDLIAGSCYRDGLAANNWRARIQDTRVSGTAEINANEGRRYYAIAQMPDGNWWLAQNLDYRKSLTWYANVAAPTTAATSTSYTGMYWCPAFDAGSMVVSTKSWCDRYGALYPLPTAMSANGLGTPASTTTASPSGVQGVCPPGWNLPSDPEWGRMLDCVEGDCNAKIHDSAVMSVKLGKNAGRRLSSTNMCPQNDEYCQPNVSYPAWKYTPELKASNDYGFSVVPAGIRYNTHSTYGVTYFYLGWFAFYVTTESIQRCFYDNNLIARLNWNYGSGYTIRCVR